MIIINMYGTSPDQRSELYTKLKNDFFYNFGRPVLGQYVKVQDDNPLLDSSEYDFASLGYLVITLDSVTPAFQITKYRIHALYSFSYEEINSFLIDPVELLTEHFKKLLRSLIDKPLIEAPLQDFMEKQVMYTTKILLHHGLADNVVAVKSDTESYYIMESGMVFLTYVRDYINEE